MKNPIGRFSTLTVAAVIAATASGCQNNDTTPTDPSAAPSAAVRKEARHAADEDSFPGPQGFVAGINNPYLPFVPGTVFEYRGIKDEMPEINRVHVTRATKQIVGVTTTVVVDSVFVDGFLHEATADWYAQDKEGTVWYFGEDSKEFDQTGTVISTHGSWEAGIAGAQPGIVMQDHPEVGDTYRQELARGVAEDMAKVLSLKASVEVPYGRFRRSLKTQEWTPLSPGVAEHKYYARRIGLLKTVMVEGGTDHAELTRIWIE